MYNRFLKNKTTIIKESIDSAISIIKIILPILYILQILKYFELIEPLSILLLPIMELLELPDEFAIVWIVGLLSSEYGAIVTFFYIINDPSNYTIAEVTTLSALILIAHALPIESKVSKLLGVGFLKTIFFRLFCAILFAFLVKSGLDYFNLLQDKIYLTEQIHENKTTLFWLFVNPIITCLQIGFIIVSLHILIYYLKKINVIHYFEIALKPLAYILQIDSRLSSSLLIGMLLGISYGGALLLKDFKSLPDVSKH